MGYVVPRGVWGEKGVNDRPQGLGRVLGRYMAVITTGGGGLPRSVNFTLKWRTASPSGLCWALFFVPLVAPT